MVVHILDLPTRSDKNTAARLARVGLAQREKRLDHIVPGLLLDRERTGMKVWAFYAK